MSRSKRSRWLYGQTGSNSLAGLTSAQKRVLSAHMRPSTPCRCTWTASLLTSACQHPVTGYHPTQTAKCSAPEGKGLGWDAETGKAAGTEVFDTEALVQVVRSLRQEARTEFCSPREQQYCQVSQHMEQDHFWTQRAEEGIQEI